MSGALSASPSGWTRVPDAAPTAKPKRPPIGRLLRLSPLFAGCLAAMAGAYVAGADARRAAARDLPSPRTLAAVPIDASPSVAALPLRGPLADGRDLECLTQAVYYEARGEPESGQAAVAQVVLNRTRAGRYPRSVCGVVFQHARSLGRAGCQFSFACDRRTLRPRERAAWDRAEHIARATLAGRRAAMLPTSATQFRVAGLSSAGLERVAQIGAHVFYRLGHAGRAPPPPPVQLAAPPRGDGAPEPGDAADAPARN